MPQVIGGLTKMMAEPEAWCGPATLREESGAYQLNDERASDPGQEADA